MKKLRKKIKAGSGCYEHVLFSSIPCRWPYGALIIQQSCEECLPCPLFNYIRSRKKANRQLEFGPRGFRSATDETIFLLDCRKWTNVIKVENSRWYQTGFSLFSPDWAKLLCSSCCWCSPDRDVPCNKVRVCLKTQTVNAHISCFFANINCLTIQVIKSKGKLLYNSIFFFFLILCTRKMVLTLIIISGYEDLAMSYS